MSLAFLPRRTDAATAANAVRRPLFGLQVNQRVRLDEEPGVEAVIVGWRRTPVFGLPEYQVERADTGACQWIAACYLSPIGRPRLRLIQGDGA